ncbi:hypothetical protein CEP54_016001 [Fusarium duplospermum]|uniref:Aminoglycoside phosphotransferase domain-containing protein n=1 Tax=Fusarium duplospermum TaxID=1325734 RepID=A0A428NJ65_9HYPO|nr:hypothetical protein CEP54_016001 [Fusarium duplospermum]
MATNETPGLSACSAPTLTARVLPQSSFFQERRAPALPSPAEIRALNEASCHHRLNHPSPVLVPSLGLAVKYGADVTIAEVETQILMRKKLRGRVPIPEVFGWAEDGGQNFIYMSLVRGDTLQARFSTMDESERQAVCKELRSMANAWRALTQEPDIYIGSIGKRPLNDIFVTGQSERVGPFLGTEAVQKFHDACGIDISNDIPIIFTHNDFCPPNILLSCGPNPRVVGILDWGQSGWYPWYWEYCKARRVGIVDETFGSALQEEWHTTYLPEVIDTVDNESFYHPWLYFMLSNI